MKTVLITGGNKGIGYSTALALGKQGWHILIGARNEERGLEAIQKLKDAGVKKTDFVQIDLSIPEMIDRATGDIGQRFSQLNLLINNAGVPGAFGPNLEETVDDLRATMDVNFFGTFQLTQGLVPLLEKSHGRIINITIPTGPNPNWNPLSYKSSKAAQNVMMSSLAIDFEKESRNVEIFSIHPGPTTTDLNGNMEGEGFHTADDVAEKIVTIINDGKSHQGEMLEIYGELF
ncbi:SDR family NAD(P)-dependent oxidoreductase [Pediococcus claussenii]|uniref:Short chain dehydrogenase family protein n=1 Tax=Pediococcus claussenii (strain ATCC BAA-344 / DSM 14800 / JCM 18046 / KCTC 3811 / LMG 21948 / P06) TaxID=701521 RepID=G8PBV5_PEDCP|nr:SDR family NAD(P)-dependent oxidoreductase [Pediococcus claussenii]AEV96013.1 short chain dehydrogenase family protein [Pediococcus claussenii ATCC BAA-344]ANZ69498.1 carbonyl reductase [Pediococcus claussenii]ANZ71317.1 carbonyl reductase [Pediococcus claussenii]KRN19461.1 hypothetical protein IV79_GL001514 [Pediococcus claussenii]